MGGRGGKARARVDANAPGSPPAAQPDATASPEPPPEPPPTEQDQPAGLEHRVQDAYRELASKPQDWVKLSTLREALGNPDKDELDRIVKTMIRTGMVHLAPDSDRKNLTDADHAAAIRIGSEDKHLLAIEPDFLQMAAASQDRTEPKPPVSGTPSDKPVLPNEWGTFASRDAPIAYHDDGPIGTAVKHMGADQRMSVDGEPLANVLGRLATEVNHGHRTPQEGLDAMKELRDRLPNGSRAQSCLDLAIQDIDAPRGPAPVMPDSTPEPLRKLVHDLHDIPIVRRQPDRELKPLLRIIDDIASGETSPGMADMEIEQLLDRRHESYVDTGWRQIREAIIAARAGYRQQARNQRAQP